MTLAIIWAGHPWASPFATMQWAGGAEVIEKLKHCAE